MWKTSHLFLYFIITISSCTGQVYRSLSDKTTAARSACLADPSNAYYWITYNLSYDATQYHTATNQDYTQYECRNCTDTVWDSNSYNEKHVGTFTANSDIIGKMYYTAGFASVTNTRIGVIGNNDFADFFITIGKSCPATVGLIKIISVIGTSRCVVTGGMECGGSSSSSDSDSSVLLGLSVTNVIIISACAGGAIILGCIIVCCCTSSETRTRIITKVRHPRTQMTAVVTPGGGLGCAHGHDLSSSFTCGGCCCALWCFPCGLICCFSWREKHCSRCGGRFG